MFVVPGFLFFWGWALFLFFSAPFVYSCGYTLLLLSCTQRIHMNQCLILIDGSDVFFGPICWNNTCVWNKLGVKGRCQTFLFEVQHADLLKNKLSAILIISTLFSPLSIFTFLSAHYVWLKGLILYWSMTDAFALIILSLWTSKSVWDVTLFLWHISWNPII